MARLAVSRNLRWLLIAGVVCTATCLLWYVAAQARRAAQRMCRHNDMKQIGLALHNFHDVYKHLPPAVRRDEAGRPLSSWRFQLLPYLEAMMLGVEFDERWDHPGNRYLVTHYTYYCWNRTTDFPACSETSVVAITGPGTAFEDGRVVGLGDMDADTVLAIEVPHSDTLWLEPGDLMADEFCQSHLSGVDGTGTHVLFQDGTVWFLRSETPAAELQKFLTIEDARQYDRDQVLGRYRLESGR